MADATLAVSGGVIKTYQRSGAGTPHEEFVRDAPVTDPTLDEWAISTTVRASPIAAATHRVSVLFWNDSDVNTVYLRFDGTQPTASSHMIAIPPRSIIPLDPRWCRLNIRMIGSGTGGTLHTSLGGADT
jgi:hypothetical protein